MTITLFGKRGDALLDAWSLVHLAFWFMVGANLAQLNIALWLCWVLTIGGAFVWELIETWLDELDWFQMTKESKLNRWVSDPIMACIGMPIGMYVING
jgi:fucose 4-O-acetylase-like acetyltransferase